MSGAPPPGPATRVARRPDTASREVGGQTLVITPRDRTLHTLNETAALLWRALGEGEGATVEALVAALLAAYDCDPARARRDVAEHVAALATRGLVTLS